MEHEFKIIALTLKTPFFNTGVLLITLVYCSINNLNANPEVGKRTTHKGRLELESKILAKRCALNCRHVK